MEDLQRRHKRHGASGVVPAADEAHPLARRSGTAAESRPRPGACDRASPEGELQSKAIGEALGLAPHQVDHRWITRALEEGAIEPTIDNPHAPGRAFRLTAAGGAVPARAEL